MIYDWGEFKVKVEEARVFDTKNNKFIGSVPCAKMEDVDFDKLVKELVKRKIMHKYLLLLNVMIIKKNKVFLN